MNIPAELMRGDILLYYSADFVDRVIAWKEGDDVLPVAHVEVYAGNGRSWASRNGIGVNIYPFRPDGLVMVRRPLEVFDVDGTLDAWFQTIIGTPYGTDDIVANAGITIANPRGMDCSHCGALIMERAGCPQFDDIFPKKLITPRDFQLTRESDQFFPALN